MVSKGADHEKANHRRCGSHRAGNARVGRGHGGSSGYQGTRDSRSSRLQLERVLFGNDRGRELVER